MKETEFFEASVIEGLESIAQQELHHRFGSQAHLLRSPEAGSGVLQFTYGGSPRNLLQLKTVVSLFWARTFAVPRPRALMGHQNFQLLLVQIDQVRKLSPKNAYRTVYLAAAGSESSVMQRLVEEIARETGLAVSYEEGDLLIRLRRPLDGSDGWDALVRMTPRPLSVRSWRVCDYKGALNAAAAHGLALLTQPRPEDVFLNIACGSGSILIERANIMPVRLAIGCDTSPEALDCARANVAASGKAARIRLAPWDARSLPLADGSVDVICSDLPFGHYIGTHQENVDLYPQILNEAARVAGPDARCVLLTHEVRLMTNLLENSADWSVQDVLTLTLNGLHPRVFIIKRRHRTTQ